jgi:SAM-dependent methyltransferase
MARAYSGCVVLHQDFLATDLPELCFDGVFANASLFHIPSAELPRVLRELARAVRPGGVLVASNPRSSGGVEQEGWSGDRYACSFELERWRELLALAGWAVVRHYYRPDGRPRDEQPWLVTVSTR